jgi:single-stranded DNA-binding protein
MKSQKFLPGTQLSGKILDTKVEKFKTQNGNAVKFVILVKDVWKDKDGNKQESEPYYADCVAFGDKMVDTVDLIVQTKAMAVARVLPRLEKWEDKTTNLQKSKTTFKVSFLEGWYFESGEWHTSDLKATTTDDLPF